MTEADVRVDMDAYCVVLADTGYLLPCPAQAELQTASQRSPVDAVGAHAGDCSEWPRSHMRFCMATAIHLPGAAGLCYLVDSRGKLVPKHHLQHAAAGRAAQPV